MDCRLLSFLLLCSPLPTLAGHWAIIFVYVFTRKNWYAYLVFLIFLFDKWSSVALLQKKRKHKISLALLARMPLKEVFFSLAQNLAKLLKEGMHSSNGQLRQTKI